MHITTLEKVDKLPFKMDGAEGAYKQIPLSRKDGVPTFSFRVFTIEPRGHTPFHQHQFEHMNYVIEGNGILLTEHKKYEVKKGDFALVLPGEKHQFLNNSENRDFVIICAVPREYE